TVEDAMMPTHDAIAAIPNGRLISTGRKANQEGAFSWIMSQTRGKNRAIPAIAIAKKSANAMATCLAYPQPSSLPRLLKSGINRSRRFMAAFPRLAVSTQHLLSCLCSGSLLLFSPGSPLVSQRLQQGGDGDHKCSIFLGVVPSAAPNIPNSI